MIRVRRSGERGHFDHGWLDTYHTFSFAGYYDPAQVGFRALRVINEDRVAAGQGFGMHGHENMEIVTVVLDGALAHRDSLGHESVLHPGEVQRMSAGTGIMHSEFNPSDREPVHLYQIWLRPGRRGLEPSYEQKAFSPDQRAGRLQVVASPDGREGSLRIGQDASLYLADLAGGQRVEPALEPGRHAWVQVLGGHAVLDGQPLAAGDGAAVSGQSRFELAGTGSAQVLVFDLA